jgi:CRISPR-associated protein Cas2
MTIVVTRNSPERFRGFLASCMCEVAPGVYTAPRMSQGVRDRVWHVLVDWFSPAGDHALLMTYPEPTLPGGQAFRVLGAPRQELCEHDGVFLARREIEEKPGAERESADGRGMVPPSGAS